jgi:hypothetical protein
MQQSQDSQAAVPFHSSQPRFTINRIPEGDALHLEPWTPDSLASAKRATKPGAQNFAAAHVGRIRSLPLAVSATHSKPHTLAPTVDPGKGTSPQINGKRSTVDTLGHLAAQQVKVLQAGFGDRDAGRCAVDCVLHLKVS